MEYFTKSTTLSISHHLRRSIPKLDIPMHLLTVVAHHCSNYVSLSMCEKRSTDWLSVEFRVASVSSRAPNHEYFIARLIPDFKVDVVRYRTCYSNYHPRSQSCL